MNELVTKNENHIEDMIYEIRGKQVMLVSDLAKIFHKETRVINQKIKRNLNKFPANSCFQLTFEEFSNLRSQFVISTENQNKTLHGGNRYLPYVLTESGIDFLVTILNVAYEDQKYIKIIKSIFLKESNMNYNAQISIENQDKISSMIYEVRGRQVMLDTDLARLYQCKNGTKDVNKAVNRNIQKFPEDFYFQLTYEEYLDVLRFQNGTLKIERGKFRKYLPYVFTEQGVAMLATVLKTEVASKISVDIMRAFVLMRKYLSTNLLEQRYFKNMLLNHDEDLKLIHKTLEQLESKKLTNEIYYEGQIYDAYSKLIDIMNMADKELIIIDSYADKRVLDMISKIDKKVILIMKERGLLKRIDLEKYNQQYHNLKVIRNNTFHDRYLILDKRDVYHLGTSLNHAGSKTFGVNKLEDRVMIDTFINYVLKIIKSKK